MAQIFISYKRSDREFVDTLIPLIREKYDVWFDEEIIGGTNWWEKILKEIADCDLFIYLISDESLESPYCQSEFLEALRLRKQFLPVVIKPLSHPYPGKPSLDPQFARALSRTQNIDLTHGVEDQYALDKLYRDINYHLTQAPLEPPTPTTPIPVSAPTVDDNWFFLNMKRGLAIIAIVLISYGFIALILRDSPVFADNNPTGTPQPDATTSVAAVIPATQTVTPTATLTEQQTITPSPTETEMSTASPTMEPDTETPTASLTLTSVPPTAEPTIAPTIEPTTAVPATAAPTTIAPSLTASSPIPTATRMWATVDPDRLQPALQMVSENGDWHPYKAIQILPNGVQVEMVLVPAGCFTIGSTGQQHCFRGETDLFWIDVHEVYNEQYSGQIGGNYTAGTWQDYTRFPRDRQTWTAASNFCEWRGGRLPLDEEWEYTARGVDGQIYPWSGTRAGLDKTRAVYGENQPRPVGSLPSGVSWVGAMDMIGNLREWTNAGSLQSPSFEVRGGSWNDQSTSPDLSTTKRRRLSGSTGEIVTGFRCVLPYQTGLDKLVDFK